MKVSIVGCGWLGLPLAKTLVAEGFHVAGSTTSREKLSTLKENGIEPYLLKFDPMPIGEKFNPLFQTDCLIINIPPGRKTNTPAHYEEQIKYLKYLIQQHNVPRVIFVSSTSYYPNSEELVSEEMPFDFEKGSSKAVVQGEKQIRQIESELLVLRCAGLMGEGRIPGKWFAGKPTTGSETPVNYIHRDDVIRIIHQQLLTSKFAYETLNLVCPNHPTRQEVHEAMAKKYGFENPVWQAPHKVSSKIVSGERLESIRYEFTHPNPLEF